MSDFSIGISSLENDVIPKLNKQIKDLGTISKNISNLTVPNDFTYRSLIKSYMLKIADIRIDINKSVAAIEKQIIDFENAERQNALLLNSSLQVSGFNIDWNSLYNDFCWKMNDTFNWLNNQWTNLKNFDEDDWNELYNKVCNKLDDTCVWVKKQWNNIKNLDANDVETWYNSFVNKINEAPSWFNNLWNNITNFNEEPKIDTFPEPKQGDSNWWKEQWENLGFRENLNEWRDKFLQRFDKFSNDLKSSWNEMMFIIGCAGFLIEIEGNPNNGDLFFLRYQKFDSHGNYGIDQGIFHLDLYSREDFEPYIQYLMNNYGMTELDATNFLCLIDSMGVCAYATEVNQLVAYFSNEPELFEEIFGFPLYKKTENGYEVNGTMLLIDLYVHSNRGKDRRNRLESSFI